MGMHVVSHQSPAFFCNTLLAAGPAPSNTVEARNGRSLEGLTKKKKHQRDVVTDSFSYIT